MLTDAQLDVDRKKRKKKRKKTYNTVFMSTQRQKPTHKTPTGGDMRECNHSMKAKKGIPSSFKQKEINRC